MDHEQIVDEYIAFQNLALSPFHAVAALKERFVKRGFVELALSQEWSLSVGQAYFVAHPSDKSIIAFHVGQSATTEAGFAMIGAHTDSPVLRLRLTPWAKLYDYETLLSERHGSLILRSWLDRPLLLAGQTYTYARSRNGKPEFSKSGLPIIERKMVQSPWPIAIIPDVAIHLDREKNEKGALNLETMMMAITGRDSGEDARLALFETLGGPCDGFELNFALATPHTRFGSQREFIAGSRHDDLLMVFVAQCALETAVQHGGGPKTAVAAFFDAEETGSTTADGACSFFIEDILMRIHQAHPLNNASASFGQSLAASFLISADLAHGTHPGYRERHDLNHKPLLNGGPVLKMNANDRYASSGYSATVFRALCKSVDVPVQEFSARQDMGCGSTIGPHLAAKLGCATVDVGLPLLAMHSAVETAGAWDLLPCMKVFERFYRGA